MFVRLRDTHKRIYASLILLYTVHIIVSLYSTNAMPLKLHEKNNLFFRMIIKKNTIRVFSHISFLPGYSLAPKMISHFFVKHTRIYIHDASSVMYSI